MYCGYLIQWPVKVGISFARRARRTDGAGQDEHADNLESLLLWLRNQAHSLAGPVFDLTPRTSMTPTVPTRRQVVWDGVLSGAGASAMPEHCLAGTCRHDPPAGESNRSEPPVQYSAKRSERPAAAAATGCLPPPRDSNSPITRSRFAEGAGMFLGLPAGRATFGLAKSGGRRSRAMARILSGGFR